MQEQLSLVPVSTAALAPALLTAEKTRPLKLAVFGLSSLMAIFAIVSGMPLLSMGMSAMICFSSLALASAVTMERPGEQPQEDPIESYEARMAMHHIRAAHVEIERALGTVPHLKTMASGLVDRCANTVKLAERLARLANPLQRYLDSHDPMHARAELARLQAHAELAEDAATIAALGRATIARTHQLQTRDEMLALRARIIARLELARAVLESFAATLVKLRVLDEEQLLFGDETVMDQLDDARSELEALESALDLELAATA